MTEYRFATHWYLDAPLQSVWDVIFDSDAWPTWWRDVLRVDLLQAGNAQGLGAVRRFTWKTALPYRLVFKAQTTRIEPPHLLEAAASGELVGSGLWRLNTQDQLTHVRYDWNVRTTRAWMNLLAPVARPAFTLNHRLVMRRGGEDLARHLRARLVRG